jgi:hypothetical protein
MPSRTRSNLPTHFRPTFPTYTFDPTLSGYMFDTRFQPTHPNHAFDQTTHCVLHTGPCNAYTALCSSIGVGCGMLSIAGTRMHAPGPTHGYRGIYNMQGVVRVPGGMHECYRPYVLCHTGTKIECEGCWMCWVAGMRALACWHPRHPPRPSSPDGQQAITHVLRAVTDQAVAYLLAGMRMHAPAPAPLDPTLSTYTSDPHFRPTFSTYTSDPRFRPARPAYASDLHF